MKRLVNRPAAGSAVVFTCDDGNLSASDISNTQEWSIKGTEVQLRVDDHLRKFLIFTMFRKFTVLKKNEKNGYFFRFDEQTNKMLIKSKKQKWTLEIARSLPSP
ncbi:conjugal transfer protein TraY [Klebsiella pneumoniae]